MNKYQNTVHREFRFQGIRYDLDDLNDVAYSLIKEGDKEERFIGDFLMDWISSKDYVEVFTSGSTGEPKPIKLPKQAMINSAKATGQLLGLKEGDTALLCLSAQYIAAKMMLVRAMILGLSLDYVSPSSAALSTIKKVYDFSAMVPMQLENSWTKLSAIKKLLVGGAPISNEMGANLHSLKGEIYETYGMTETATHIALKPLTASARKRLKTDSENFKTLPGITISQDKNHCLEIDASSLGLKKIRTKDVVKLHSNSAFTWVGRYDHVINSGGVKIFPEQIEQKLNPVIQEKFMVTGRPDKSLGEKVVLVVENPADIIALKSAIQNLKSLEKYEVPKDIIAVDVLKTATNGKIMRNAVKSMLAH